MPPKSSRPGFKIGRHRLPYWIARQVVRDPMGYPHRCVPLPPDGDEAAIARLCREYTASLLAWIGAERKGEVQRTRYDGTVLAACRLYQEHPQSRFHKVKRNTRRSYTASLDIIERTVGKRLIRNVTVIDVQHWYDQWRKPAGEGAPERIDRAHDAVSMLRTILNFCAALRHKDCKQIAEELERVRFEKGGAREEEMTHEQAKAFIRTALAFGQQGRTPEARARSMAIGVAAQFELLLRQKDIIGEWGPAGTSKREVLILGAEAWTGYFTWENVPGWRLRLKTSKSKYRAAVDYDLTRYSLLIPLLEAVPHAERAGAIVKDEHGLPVRESSYRKWFRAIARAAGIPDEVWLMDARAGGATEAEEAGAAFEDISDALTHSKKETTVRYIRRRSARIASVQDARNRRRASEQGGGDGA